MPDPTLLDILTELLRQREISAEQLETSIRNCPGLITAEAQDWLSMLALSQENSESRAAVNNLARLLRRLQTETKAVVFADEALRTRAESMRQAREARRRAAQEKFLAWRNEPRAPLAESGPMPSLAEVVAYLRSISVAERRQPYGRNILDGRASIDSVPAYLFRGESGGFASTYSSMARLSASARAREDITHIHDRLVHAFGERYELTMQQALGFLQHYGFPTEYVDVTSDVSVAASFASSLRVGEVGAMCIIPTEPLLSRGNLIDLRRHPMAPRPRLQSAFALHVPEYPDLKASDAVAVLQLTWIKFRLTELDASRFMPDFELLDAHADEVAGLIWLLIDDCAKFSDEAAALLSALIDPAPVFAVAGAAGELVLVSEDEVMAFEAVNDDAFRRSKYESWSDAFVAPERQPVPPELEAALGDASDLEPGAVLKILTSRAIMKAGKPKR